MMRVALCQGEPAGCGLDICVAMAQQGSLPQRTETVYLGDVDALRNRAKRMNKKLRAHEYNPDRVRYGLALRHIPLPSAPVVLGSPNPAHAPAILQVLREAAQGCLSGEFAAMVTLPLQKSSILSAGITFSGQTEFLGDIDGNQPLMLLDAGPDLRVATVTNHLPLRLVPAAIKTPRICRTIEILDRALRERWGIERPRIAVCGLNPHAGEAGYLGNEDVKHIQPAIEKMQKANIACVGPLPADSVFAPRQRILYDAILSMYHDQGLSVIKALYFDQTVNVSCGLSFVRTSPDHGTALDIAGLGRASTASSERALRLAVELASATPV